jgi:GPH family glycoside/pentoside/hexuronide:cation symporter
VTSESAAAPSHRPPLALADKLLYAFASVGNSALFWSQSLWLIFFYSGAEGSGQPVRIPVELIGLALGIGKFIEIFDDPIIGWWSDRTRGRLGRRIPFLLFGTPVVAVSFWLIWNPPVAGQSLVNAIFFFVVIEAFFLGRTVVEAPYDALQAEIVRTSPERVSLGAWKVFFAILGVVMGLVLSPQLEAAFGFSGMGLILSVVFVIALYVTLFGLWSRGVLRPRAERLPEESPPLFGSMLAALRHRHFLALAASFMLFNLGYQLLIMVMPFFLTVALAAGRDDVTWFTGGVTLLVLLALPPLTLASRRFSKRALYAGSMAGLGAYLVFLAFAAFRPVIPGIEHFPQALALISLSGLGFAALFVFPGAMVADVIDDDARRTGQGRAAIFYGMFKTLEKLAQSVAAVVFGFILGAFGATRAEPLGVQLILPVAGIFVLAGFATVFLGYHLREAPRPTDEAAPEAPAPAAAS